MAPQPGFVQLLVGGLGVVNCVHQTKQLDVRWQFTRVHPPFIRIYQIRRSRYYNDFPQTSHNVMAERTPYDFQYAKSVPSTRTSFLPKARHSKMNMRISIQRN